MLELMSPPSSLSLSLSTHTHTHTHAHTGAKVLLVAGLLCIYAYAFLTTGLSLLAVGGVTLVVLGTLAGTR